MGSYICVECVAKEYVHKNSCVELIIYSMKPLPVCSEVNTTGDRDLVITGDGFYPDVPLEVRIDQPAFGYLAKSYTICPIKIDGQSLNQIICEIPEGTGSGNNVYSVINF